MLQLGDVLCGMGSLQVITLKNGKMWGEARFGGTYGVGWNFLRGGTCVF